MRWQALDPWTWIPSACRVSAIVMALVLLVGGAAVAFAASRCRLPLSVSDGVALALQAWCVALGAPVSVRFDASVEVGATMTAAGAFDGTVQAGVCAAALLAALPLAFAGAWLARALDACSEREHLVSGLLVAPVLTAMSVGLALALAFTPQGVPAGDVRISGRIVPSVLSLTVVVMAWALLAGPLGALFRYRWRVRGIPHWDAAMPRLASVLAAACGFMLVAAGSVSLASTALERPDSILPDAQGSVLAPYVAPAQRVAIGMAAFASVAGADVCERLALTNPSAPVVDVRGRVSWGEPTRVEAGETVLQAKTPYRGLDGSLALVLLGSGFCMGVLLRWCGRDAGGDCAVAAVLFLGFVAAATAGSGGWVTGRFEGITGGAATEIWGACSSALNAKVGVMVLGTPVAIGLGTGRGPRGRVWGATAACTAIGKGDIIS